MVPHKSLFNSLIVIILVNLIAPLARAEQITPNAWGIARSKARLEAQAAGNAECVQPEPSSCVCDEELGVLYYKKLVNYLFRKSRQVVDDFDGKHLISIHLQITEKQLQQLKEAESVRDIDSIVSTVIANSRNGFVQEAKEKLWSWFDRLHYYYLRTLNSQTLMLLCLTVLFIALTATMWYVFKVHFVLAIIINVLFISLFFEYLECNRRLEYSNLEQLRSMSAEANPCEQTTSFFGLRSGYDSKKCADYMMLTHGHNRQICPPTDVLSEFWWKLFFKPLTKLLDTVSDMMAQTYDKHGLLKGLPIVIGLLLLLVYWMRDLFKMFVQGLFVWGTSSRPSQSVDKGEAIAAAAAQNQPSVVNVNISIDPKAIGDYVQTLRNDEELLRAALAQSDRSTEGSPTKAIEDVSNGSEISAEEIKKEK